MGRAKVVQTQIVYGKPQELTNIITHAIGAAFGFVGLIFLMLKTIRLGSAPLGVFSVLLYGTLATVTFALCAVHHGMRAGTKARTAFGGIDRSTVAILILGVYAPIMLIGMPRGGSTDAAWGYALFAVIAAAVVAATALGSIDPTRFKTLVLVAYVVLGAACVVRIDRVWQLCGDGCFWFLFGGAAVYATGLIFYLARRLAFNHAAWHAIALVGAALHFVGIYVYLL